MADDRTIIITTLAEYQTAFWIPVCKELERAGRKTLTLAFDDRSADLYQQQGLAVHRITGRLDQTSEADRQARFAALLERYGIDNANMLFGHQRIYFGIRDFARLRDMFVAYGEGVEAALDTAGLDGESAVMVQELGGFLSVIAAFHGARRRGIDNWFIEPSFFRGRLWFTRNKFEAPTPTVAVPDRVSDEVQAYLDATIANSSIVVPLKDRHQYRRASSKIVNLRNARRLVEKSVDKYILRKHQDFGYIGRHVRQHAGMLWNSARSGRLQSPLAQAGRYVYYPLHVPADMALTLRSPEYLDQLALVGYLARIVPHTHSLVIKEHPAQIGALSAARLADLKRSYDNLVILPPSVNNYEVLRGADAVVTVNSKSGAEAMILGKPVLVLGDAFYSDCEHVTRVDSLKALPEAIADAIASPGAETGEVVRYFQSIHDSTYPGELYIAESSNVATFTRSMANAVTAADPADG